MSILILLINLFACALIWAVAMHFYLRRGAPACARQHYSQIALILVAVGAFAAGVTALKGEDIAWWEVAMRAGFAMLAGKTWIDTRRDPARVPHP